MLVVNLILNSLGLCINTLLMVNVHIPIPDHVYTAALTMDAWFLPLILCVGLIGTQTYERPIRNYLDQVFRKDPIPESLMEQARQRLLNEPFFLIAMDMVLWLLAAVAHTERFNVIHCPGSILESAFYGCLLRLRVYHTAVPYPVVLSPRRTLHHATNSENKDPDSSHCAPARLQPDPVSVHPADFPRNAPLQS
jgi:hypothetical protein